MGLFVGHNSLPVSVNRACKKRRWGIYRSIMHVALLMSCEASDLADESVEDIHHLELGNVVNTVCLVVVIARRE
jgi:hypothetical protein